MDPQALLEAALGLTPGTLSMFTGPMGTPMTGNWLQQLLGLSGGSGFSGGLNALLGGMGGSSSNPAITGLLRLIASGMMLPYANKGESSIENAMTLLQDPAKFVSNVRTLAGGMNTDLINTLKSMGEGAAAESGLGQSAGAVSSAVAKAAAPYEEENLQTSQGTLMQQIEAMLSGGNLIGSPYMNLAQMFTGGGGGINPGVNW